METYRIEMDKLAEGLAWRGICFEFKPLYDGYQIISFIDGNKWDAICHFGSYGHESGLLEIMGSVLTQEYDEYCDDVEGYLTAAEILKRIDKIRVDK